MDLIQSGLLPDVLVLGIPPVDAQHDAIFCRIENLKFLCTSKLQNWCASAFTTANWPLAAGLTK